MQGCTQLDEITARHASLGGQHTALCSTKPSRRPVQDGASAKTDRPQSILRIATLQSHVTVVVLVGESCSGVEAGGGEEGGEEGGGGKESSFDVEVKEKVQVRD